MSSSESVTVHALKQQLLLEKSWLEDVYVRPVVGVPEDYFTKDDPFYVERDPSKINNYYVPLLDDMDLRKASLQRILVRRRKQKNTDE